MKLGRPPGVGIGFAVGAVTLFICATGNARADECDTMAAAIARAANLTAGHRTQANFIPMSPVDGEYGVYLNCAGTYGLNLRFMTRPDPPPEWFQFVGRSGSVLTKVPPLILREGVQKCLNTAFESGRQRADFEHRGARFICDVGENDKRVELTITR